MDLCIFREYDIRGVIGKELHIKETYDLGLAIATFLQKKNRSIRSIIIGRDGRIHSLAIQKKFEKAFTELGFDTIDLGTVPTPATYFAVKYLNNPAAIMITASHNPKEYNGIKIWGAWGSQIQEIKKILQVRNFYKNNRGKKGTFKSFNILEKYTNFLITHFSHLKNMPLKITIDCGNGTAGTVIPKLIKHMNWTQVKALFAEVDGTFPNHETDPTIPQNMKFLIKELKNSDSVLGIGFDGDCDRMCPITKTGTLVSGDKLLAIFAEQILKQYPGATIVFDIKSSDCLVESLIKHGGRPQISPAGHSIIKEALIKHNAKLAGELSCHFFFNDRYFGYDDGIYSMMRLFEILIQTGKSLDELIKSLPQKQSTPEIKIRCTSEIDKIKIVEDVKNIITTRKDINALTIDGIRVQTHYGWGLLRASNTQPVICMRFESNSQNGLKKIKTYFFNVLKPYFSEKTLKNKLFEQ